MLPAPRSSPVAMPDLLAFHVDMYPLPQRSQLNLNW